MRLHLQGKAGVTLRLLPGRESSSRTRGQESSPMPESRTQEPVLYERGTQGVAPHRRAVHGKQNRLHEGEGGREEG